MAAVTHQPRSVGPHPGLPGDVLEEADPEGAAVPLLLSGATDARHLAALGVRTYGFTPMQLPEGFDFTDRVRAADERIPADAVEWGANRVYEAVTRYGT